MTHCFEFKVRLLDDTIVSGRADDEGVKWICVCSQPIDFKSPPAFEVTGGMRIDCPQCGRKYFSHVYIPNCPDDEVVEID